MPRHCRFGAPVALRACILTLFSLRATFLHAETSASLTPVSRPVDEKTAAPDSGATSVSSPTETAPAPVSGYGGPFGERLKLTGDWFGARDKLAVCSITLDANLTQFFQGVASALVPQCSGSNRSFPHT